MDARGSDEQVQVLAPDGTVREGASVPALDESTLREMYREMVLAREYDRRAVNLQRQGRIGTYPPLAGQEGAQVGSAFALEGEDWVFPSYREHAVNYHQGVPYERNLRNWRGERIGNSPPPEANVFSMAIPIGTQVPHAVGAAWARKLKGEDGATICYFGEGATSEGDFHEGLNFAGVFDTPSVFFCNNNQYAISVPRTRQTASETIAQKASAYGFPGIQVDGMDPLAVYQVTKDALNRARTAPDDRPRATLIEAVQYRFGAHTTADDPSVYRSDEEVASWKEKDPIVRLERFLQHRGVLSEDEIGEIKADAEVTIAEAIEAVEASEPSQPSAMFDAVYAEEPARLQRQRAEFDSLLERYGPEALRGDR